MEKQIRNYLKILETSPDNVPAFNALAKIYQDHERWSELASLYVNKSEQSANKELVPDLLFQAAEIYAERLAKMDRVEECYLKVLSTDPQNAQALDLLKKRYRESHAWDQLIALLEREAASAEDPMRQADCLVDISDLWREELDNRDKETEYLAKAQKAAPEHMPSLRRLKTRYLKSFMVDEAIQLVEREESLLESDDDRKALYVEVGMLLSEDPFEKERAIAYLEQALEMGANKKAKARLKELESLEGNWESLTRKYQEEAIKVSDKREASSIYLKVAGIYYIYSTENEDGILSTIEKALILDSGNRRALLLGERYLTERNNLERLVDFYREMEKRTRDERLKVEAMSKAAKLLGEKLGREDQALELFHEVFALNPDSAVAFEAIMKDYEAKEDWDGLRQLLTDRLSRCHELDAKVETYRQLARLAVERDNDDQAAMDYLEKVFEIAPSDLDAAEQLLPLYESAGRSEDMLAIFQVIVSATEDAEKKRQLELQWASVLKDQLDRVEDAYEHFATAFTLKPEDEDTFKQLEELTIDLECWESLMQALVEVLGREERPTNWRMLKFNLAQIYDRELSQYEDAERVYRELLDADVDLPTLDALTRLYSKDLSWENLVEIQKMKADIIDEPDERRDVLLERARIIEEEIGDAERAIEAFNDVLAVDPAELDALQSLETLYEKASLWEELVDTLEKRLQIITAMPEKISLHFKLGQVYGDNLGEKEASAKAYLAILELEPTHLPAIENLEEYLNEGVLVEDVFRGLEAYYTKLERWDKLATGYEALIKSEEDEVAKGALCHKLADVYLVHRSLPEDAFQWIKTGLNTPYQDPSFLTLSLDAARKLDKQLDLLELLEAKAETVEDSEEKARLGLSLGQLYWDGMQDAEQAEHHYLVAADALPDSADVLELVAAFFKATEQFDRYAEFADAHAAVLTDDDAYKLVLFELAEVFENSLDNRPEASARLRQILDRDAKDQHAMDELIRLLQAEDEWEEAAKWLRAKLDITEDAQSAIALRMRLGEIYEDKVEDYDEAASLYSAVLAEDPHHDGAFEAMERFIELELAEELVAKTLRPIYEDRREFDKLVRVLIVTFKFTEGDDAYQLAVSIASIYEEELADYAEALEWYGKAFLIGDGVGLLKELEISASEANDFGRFIQIGEDKLDTELSDSDRVELEFMLAETLQGQLNDPDGSRKHYQAILDVDEANERAIDALIALARDRSDYEDLVDLLAKKHLAAAEVVDRRQAAFEMAEIRFRRLDQPEEAVEVLNGLMEERENDPQVFDMLEEIFSATEKWSELHDLLNQKLKYLREDDDILPVKIQLGGLLENNLDNPDDAMEIYTDLVSNYWSYPVVGALVDRLLAQETTQLAVANEMAQKYIKVQDWPRLVTCYEIQVRYTEDPEEKASLLSKLSAIYQEKLQDPEKAFDGFARLFIEDPANQAARDELEKLAGDLGAWKELAEVYEQAGESAEDTEEAIGLFIKAARLYEDILAFQEDAIRSFRRVLGRDRNNITAVSALEGLCRKTERWEELRDIYLQRIDLTDDVAEKKELYVNICILYEHQLEDPTGATPYYENILELTDDDLEVIDKLLGLYTELERWSDKADLLAHKLNLIGAGSERNELMIEKALLHEQKLDDLASSKDLYVEVLTADEENETALIKLEQYVELEDFQNDLARFLAPYYRNHESWDRMIDMQEYQFTYSEDVDERVVLLKEMAQTYEEKLDRINLAYAVHTRAFNERPTETFVQEELERLAGLLGQYEQLVGLYAEQIDRLDPESNADTMVGLLLNLAQLNENYLRDVEVAAGHYRRVLELHENHPDALNHLERVYSLQQKWVELIEILEAKNSITEDLEEKKAILYQACNIYEEELGQNQDAIAVYRRMLELDEQDGDVLRALARLCTVEAMWEDLVEIRQRQLAIAEDEESRWHLRHQIGVVLWQRLEQIDDAIETFNGILDENHTYDPTREAMEELLALPVAELAVANILEPLYAEEQRWNDLIHTLDIQARHADEAENRRDLFLRMAALAERELEDASGAFGYTVSAFGNDAFNDTIREQMERLAAESGRWNDLAEAFRIQTLETEDTDEQVDLYLNAGRVTLREMDDPSAAEEDYSAVRENKPDNLEALEALQEIFERTSQWEKLVDVLFTKADLLEDAAERVALFTSAARVREEQMDSKTGAVDCYLKALDVDPAHLETLIELDHLYEELEDWSALRDTIAKRVELADDSAERLRLMYRMGQTVEDRLGDASAALLVYQEMLEVDDEYGDAIAAIENMITDTTLQDDALAILTPLCESKGWWERLADLLEVQLDTLSDTEARVGVLSRIKDIYEYEQSNPGRAFQVSCRIFEEDYRDEAARQEMERLAVVTGGFEGLVVTYESFFAQITEPELKIEILQKIARIHEEQLENDEASMEAYRQVLALDEENFTAMLALDRLYERLERFTDLVELIPREFALYDEPEEVVELKLRLGRLWEEKLDDTLTAIDVYRDVLDEYPDNTASMAALARLYEQGGFWEELIDIYKREVRVARGDTKKARLYAKMAEVLFEKLGRAREAIPLWNRVLQFDETNSEVMEKLEELYRSEEMWDELVNHFKRHLRGARGAEDRAAITKKMGYLYLDRMEQIDHATQLLLKVLELTPNDLQVIDTLEEIYLKNQSWAELSDLLNRLVPQVDGAELRSLYLRLAAIQIDHLKDVAEGSKLASQALDMDPTPEELTRLEGMFAKTKAHELYLNILERQALATDDEPSLVALHFRMADIWQEKLGNTEKAREQLERILALQSDNLPAAEALEPIYREAGQWSELIGVLQIRLGEADDSAQRATLLRQIADIYETRLSDAANAFEYLSEVFRLDPADLKLMAHLEELADSADRNRDMVGLLRDVLPMTDANPKLQRELILTIARLYETKAVNADLAAEYYKMFLEAGEYNEHAVDFLIGYYEEVQDWEELIAAYQQKLPYMNQSEKIEVGCRVAEIFDVKIGETDRAIKTYRQVQKMDDRNETAIEALVAIFERTERWEDLVEELRHQLHIITDMDAVNEIRLRIARLYHDKLDDTTQAKTFYRAIIAENQKHQEALDELEFIYEIEENFDELLEVLSRRVNLADSDDERITIYRKMANIWETKFDQPDMAVSYLDKILAIDSGHVEAITSLERIYRDAQDWHSLAATYQRHIDQSLDTEEIVKMFTEIGRIYGEYMKQPDKAIEHFNKALKIDDRNIGVLSALSELYIANERWDDAIETLQSMADIADTKADRVEALSRLGNIYLDHLDQPDEAKAVFDRMIEEDPTYVPALRALHRYYAATKDWPSFLDTVEEEKRYVEDPKEKAVVLFEEGRYYHQEELDADHALELYREAMELADDYQPVLKVLGEIYFERQAWDEAQPILSRLLELSKDLDVDEQSKTHYRLAFIAERNEDDAESLKHYTAAYKLDSNSLPTLEGLARTLYKRGDWDRAFRVYQTILVRFRDQKSVPELVDIFCKLGDVNGQLDKHDVAVRMYEKALDLDPSSSRALKAIVFYYESLENWKKVLQYRGRLVKQAEGDELFEQWVAIGDVYSGKLDDSDKGLEAYRHALEIKAQDVPLLIKVADLLLNQDNVADAVGVLRSAAALEEDPEQQVMLNVKLADLVREHGDEPDECIGYYNAALDVDPKRDDIFNTIETYLLDKNDWEALDENYRFMIARLPQDSEKERLELWKKLGVLLSEQSDNLEDSIKVWEVVVGLEPDNIETKERIADLYARSPEHREQAIGMHRELLRDEPKRVASYRAMWKTYFEAEEFDKAFCFGAVVQHLGETDAPAAEFYRENLGEVKSEAISTLDRKLWGSLLLHEDARHNVGQVLTILFHHVTGLMPSDLKKEGLKKKDRLDLGEHINFSTTATYLIKSLGLPTPEIYMKKGYGPGIEPVAKQPATLMIGADAFENFAQRELLFLAAKNLVLARPDFLMVTMLPENMIRCMLDSATSVFDSRFKVSVPECDAKAMKKRIDKGVPRKVREPLSGFVSEYSQMRESLDFGKWRRALTLSANRAGFLMCNDLETAVATLKKYPGSASADELDDIILDLMTFAVSDQYFHLRNYLGFSLV